jgi:uncharacterized protein (TIGR02594 family)
MPEFQYWMTPAGVLAALSVLVSSAIGLWGIKMVIPKRAYWSAWFVSACVALLAWYTNAKQAQDSANDKIELLAAFNRREPKAVPSLATTAPQWLQAAHKEIGQSEIAGVEENPRIAEYFRSIDGRTTYRDDRDDWASAFVEWSLQKAGKNGPHSIKPSAWLKWGIPVSSPTLGAIVILSFSGLWHVGFYIDEDAEFVRVLGGNQNDGVNIYRYPKSAVKGYRIPA